MNIVYQPGSYFKIVEITFDQVSAKIWNQVKTPLFNQAANQISQGVQLILNENTRDPVWSQIFAQVKNEAGIQINNQIKKYNQSQI